MKGMMRAEPVSRSGVAWDSSGRSKRPWCCFRSVIICRAGSRILVEVCAGRNSAPIAKKGYNEENREDLNESGLENKPGRPLAESGPCVSGEHPPEGRCG